MQQCCFIFLISKMHQSLSLGNAPIPRQINESLISIYVYATRKRERVMTCQTISFYKIEISIDKTISFYNSRLFGRFDKLKTQFNVQICKYKMCVCVCVCVKYSRSPHRMHS